MAITLKEEDISNYNFKLPDGLCIFNTSFKNTGDWQKTVQLASNAIKNETKLFDDKTSLLLWLKSDSFFNPSKLRKVKSIWNNQKLNWIRKEQCFLSVHNDDKGEFYSAIAKIEESQLESCLDFIRTNKESFLMLFNDFPKDLPALDDFLSSNYLDFEKAMDFFYSNDILFIRAFGNFDDKELHIDFLGKVLNTKSYHHPQRQT